MKLTTTLKDEHFQFALWLEIITKQPCCIYYFGPFSSPQEAQGFLPGYLEDLEQEGYQQICIQIKQCQPKELTIIEGETEDWVVGTSDRFDLDGDSNPNQILKEFLSQSKRS